MLLDIDKFFLKEVIAIYIFIGEMRFLENYLPLTPQYWASLVAQQ